MTRKVFLALLALVLAFSVGLVACGGVGQEEEEEEEETYELTIASTDGGSVVTPGEDTFTYDEVTVVNLETEAEDGYRFVEWTGDVSTVGNVDAPTTIITTDSDYSITANFAYGPAIPPRNPGSFVQMTIGTISVATGNMTGDIESLDPAWVYDAPSAEQIQCIYETLVFYDGEEIDRFVPVLATEWEFDSESVSYRFKIREGVKFHEGGELTAEDVEYSFERAMVQDRDGGPIWMFFQALLGVQTSDEVTFADIDGAVEVDGEWVVFHLCEHAWTIPFLQILCGPWASIVDREWCVAQGDWDGTEETWETYKNPQNPGDTVLFDKTNGTGPWKLQEWDAGVQIKLVRNDDYWREPAAFETVTTQFVEDWTTRKEALLAGDADFVDTFRYQWIYYQLEGIEELENIEDLNVYRDLPELFIDAFFFNMAIAEDSIYIGSGALDGTGIPRDFFTDIDVRKGFNYAFDWDTYIESGLSGLGEQRGSPVIEGVLFYNPDASMYSLDLTKAEEHLRAAWDGEVWERGFNFTIAHNPRNLARKTACEILAENLYAINPKFQVNIQPMDFRPDMVSNIVNRVLPMFQIGWLADYPHPDNFVVPFMASYSTFAWFQDYGYPELDQLIEDAFKELDPAVQKDLYYEIQERYYENAPSIMLCQSFSRRYFTKYVEGFYFNPMIWGLAGPLYYMSKSES